MEGVATCVGGVLLVRLVIRPGNSALNHHHGESSQHQDCDHQQENRINLDIADVEITVKPLVRVSQVN